MKIIKENTSKLTEAEPAKRIVLNFKKAGFERNPKRDFTDDGNRFMGYIHTSGMPMTYTGTSTDAYISLRLDDLGELNYSEYSKLPSYRLADMYNGVPKSEVDMSELDAAATQLMKEYKEAVGSLEIVEDDSWEDFLNNIKERATAKFNDMLNLVKNNLDSIVLNYSDKNSYYIKTIFDYLRSLRHEISQYDRVTDQVQKRRYMQMGIDRIIRPEDEDFYCKQIKEYIEKFRG